MATVLNVTVTRRVCDAAGNINVLWRPALEEVRDFAGYAHGFLAPWTDQEIIDHGSANAPQAIFAVIDGLFPGKYEQGTVV